jgi:excinuclease ABC subunit C
MNPLSSKSQIFQDKIQNAPKEPGCYMYLDSEGTIIYVGKAKILINRLKSYFINYSKLDSKTQSMIDNAVDVNYLTVDSEVEALILETNLIKKYKPKYNIMMRDDKNYTYVKFEKQVKGVNDFPRIRLVRQKDETDNAEYFGPYPSTLPLKNILKRIRKVFPYASCNRRMIQVSEDPLEVDTNNSVPCLYYHLGLCNAPCASLQNKAEYMKNFNSIKKFFSGAKNDILNDLEKQMGIYSKTQEYEQAAQVRDKINDIKYVTQSIKLDNNVDDVVISELKEQERREAIAQIIEFLKFPPDILKMTENFKIECYDISNIQGTNAVGSMTVMVNGQLRKDLYRKFKIRMKNEPNDFAMLQEVLTRRFGRAGGVEGKTPDPSFSILPDLIIIDGGKGQLASTYRILRDLNLHNIIPIVGLAKKEEELFRLTKQFQDQDWPDPTQKTFTRILLPRRSEALFLVQRIRDEAHRFGITYHRKLRSKQMINKVKKL